MKKTIIIILSIIFLPLVIVILISTCLYLSADMQQPEININQADYVTEQRGDTLFCKDSYLYQNEYKLWELNVQGSSAEKGAKIGALAKDLLKYQEDVFIKQIREIIPSDSYLNLLRYMTIIFNRNIAENIDLEYREEIAAISEFCTEEYNAIGTPYERQLNYHAAHDIGHAMQQYMLVGCSSFGVWGNRSSTGELLIARNFDFYVGDDFAKNRTITFSTPDKGYKYVSISWAGMMGVLSGINEQGLTVTINAAKGAVPTSSATPISILAREILQYASTIEEAYEIASTKTTFVSESILIGSRKDNSAAIIEKTPKEIALFSVDGEEIISTNHYQSAQLGTTEVNIENIKNSDSKYRYDRVTELLQQDSTLDYKKAIDILRNRYGKNGKDVGIGNEMTPNQSIAHHSVVFATTSNKMWVSTANWQSGTMLCYDLDGFFKNGDKPRAVQEYTVDADSTFIKEDLPRLLAYRDGVKAIQKANWKGQEVEEDVLESFLTQNPNNYYTYRLLGDYYLEHKQKDKAIEYYTLALSKEIPYNSERIEISKIIEDEKR